MSLRLLAVHAHPDDESSKGAATYAYYAAYGAEVTVVSCTGGERGDIQNEGLQARAMAERDMAGLRRLEMAAAAQAMGVQHRWLGYLDSGLPGEGDVADPLGFASIPVEFPGETLVRVIRELRPQVMVTYDENGGYPHPDHIRTHEVSLWAFAAAADANQFPDAGAPWQISKIYYDQIFNSPRIEAVHAAMIAREPSHPMSEELAKVREWMRERPYLATTQIDVGNFLHVRDEALRAHASQVSPESPFFFWPNDVHRAAWPWEDFQLAVSLVEAPDAVSDVSDVSDEGAGSDEGLDSGEGLDSDEGVAASSSASQILETDLFAGITDDSFSAYV